MKLLNYVHNIEFILCCIILQNAALFSIEQVNSNQVVKCLVDLAEHISDPNILIVSTNQTITLTKPAISIAYRYDLNKLSNQGRIDAYIFLLNNIEELHDWLDQAFEFNFWNPRGRFIVNIVNEKNVTKILETAWYFYVININVVVLNSIAEVYTFYPYKNGSCGKKVVSELVWNCEDSKLLFDLFPNKIPKTFEGCTVNLIALYMAPYVINYSIDRNDVLKAGIEVSIMATIAERLKFTEKYLKHAFHSWGDCNPNRTFTGLYQAVYSKHADVMFGAAPMDSNPSIDFEGSVMYINDEFFWFVPAAKESPKWENLIRVFGSNLLISLALSYFIYGLIYWFFGRLKDISNFGLSMLTCLAVLLQVCIRLPNTSIIRILFVFWTIFSLLIYTAFQSQLVSTLTTPHYEKQISNRDELVQSGMLFGFFSLAARIFINSTDKSQIIIRNTYIQCPLTNECINRTAFKQDFATLKNRRYMYYSTKKHYLDSEGRSLIFGFREGSTLSPKLIVKKGCAVLGRFNEIILLLHSNGLIQKWETDMDKMYEVTMGSDLEQISLSHLALAFLCLCIGLVFALVVFVIEIVF